MVLKITLSEVAGPEIGRRGRRKGVDWLGFRGGQKPHCARLYFGQVFRAFSGSIPVMAIIYTFWHDWAVVPEAQAPKNGRFIAAEAVPGVTPGRSHTDP